MVAGFGRGIGWAARAARAAAAAEAVAEAHAGAVTKFFADRLAFLVAELAVAVLVMLCHELLLAVGDQRLAFVVAEFAVPVGVVLVECLLVALGHFRLEGCAGGLAFLVVELAVAVLVEFGDELFADLRGQAVAGASGAAGAVGARSLGIGTAGEDEGESAGDGGEGAFHGLVVSLGILLAGRGRRVHRMEHRGGREVARAILVVSGGASVLDAGADGTSRAAAG